MAKLEYTFKNDTLFKMLFIKYPELLKRLVARLLDIHVESIDRLEIKNPEMTPEVVGGKFCRLDINMIVDGQLVDLEIQVNDEGDYIDRSVYYWSREFTTSLDEGKLYSQLPRTIVISIVAFPLFDCVEFHSEFRPLEVTRGTLLTDKMCFHYFELPKLPEVVDGNDELKLWLQLFKAETEEELEKIQKIGGSVMVQVINAYRHVSATEEFRELERQRHFARHNEAAALANATAKATRKNSTDIAKKMLTMDIDVDKVVAATGLDLNDVLKLKGEM